MTQQAQTIWLRMAIQLALMQRAIRDHRRLTAGYQNLQQHYAVKLPLVNNEPAHFRLDILEREGIEAWK